VTHLRFIADMNISPLTVSELKENGWEIIRVSDVLDPSAEDVHIIEWARENGYVIITQDLDFSSIITLRLTVVDPEKVAEKLQNVYPKIIEQLQEGYAITIDDSSMRLRKLPI
jgi:predicted nuclease of predicted toxin-antitoxin system